MTYMRCLRVLHVWSSVRVTVWSDCSLDGGMHFLRCLEHRSSCYRHLLLRIWSQRHTHYAQSMLCEFIWRGQVISGWQRSCLYVLVAVGLPVSKHWLSHWIVEAITLAYASKNEAYAWGVHAHSTRTMVSSWA